MLNIFPSATARRLTLCASIALIALTGCAPEVHPGPSSKAQAQAGGARELPRVMSPDIKGTMSRHAEHAAALTLAVALGDFDAISLHAGELHAEPTPAPPNPEDPSTLNHQLPTKLFELNENFRTALSKLQAAARASDEEQTIVQLGAVMRACRSCHRKLKTSIPAR